MEKPDKALYRGETFRFSDDPTSEDTSGLFSIVASWAAETEGSYSKDDQQTNCQGPEGPTPEDLKA